MRTELPYASATELAARIRAGELTASEVVNASLERIAQYDDDVNAFVTVLDKRAREAAKAADDRLQAEGPDGPLHGVPVAIKDDTNVAGVPTTYGSTAFADNLPDTDSILVQRLRDAGAIVVGKTNTPEFGRKPMTTNLLSGTTSNPWQLSKTVGGSSGGSAAALAAGMVPLAQGSDAAGSLRIPASACGVCGFMPDFGRIPMGPDRGDAYVELHPYTVLGPMARSVQDIALVLDVVTGACHIDPYSLPAPSTSYEAASQESIESWDIAYSHDLGLCEVQPDVTAVVDGAVTAFSDAGATIHRTDPGFEASWESLHDALEVLLQERYLGMYDRFKRNLGIDLLDESETITTEVLSRIRKGQRLSVLDVRRAEETRTNAYDAMTAFFDDYDILITPTLGIPPFENETKPRQINGRDIDPLHGWALTWPLNLTGTPSMSVPAGFTTDGLPVGLQIVGPRLNDAAVVRAAAALEAHRPWRDSYTRLS